MMMRLVALAMTKAVGVAGNGELCRCSGEPMVDEDVKVLLTIKMATTEMTTTLGTCSAPIFFFSISFFFFLSEIL